MAATESINYIEREVREIHEFKIEFFFSLVNPHKFS